jgi:hypothetical protein
MREGVPYLFFMCIANHVGRKEMAYFLSSIGFVVRRTLNWSKPSP